MPLVKRGRFLSGGLLLLCTFMVMFGIGNSGEPQAVPFIRQSGVLPGEWYLQQSRDWEKTVGREPHNAAAWFNYFLATEYSFRQGLLPREQQEQTLSELVGRMEKQVPDAFEYYLVRARFSHDEAALNRAHDLNPNHPEPYFEFLTKAQIGGDTAAFERHAKSLYRTREIPEGLLNYNYNVLMSLEPGAIIFSNGDNDTYPVWVLQGAKGVRRDVLLLNIHLARFVPEYLTRQLARHGISVDKETLPGREDPAFLAHLCQLLQRQAPAAPLYLALTVEKSQYEIFRKDLYLTGLAFRYSQNRYDNVSDLLNRFMPSARLDYLRYDWYSEEHIAREHILTPLKLNYIAPFVMISEAFEARGDSRKAAFWQDFALQLAQDGGIEGDLKSYIKEGAVRD